MEIRVLSGEEIHPGNQRSFRDVRYQHIPVSECCLCVCVSMRLSPSGAPSGAPNLRQIFLPPWSPSISFIGSPFTGLSDFTVFIDYSITMFDNYNYQSSISFRGGTNVEVQTYSYKAEGNYANNHDIRTK